MEYLIVHRAGEIYRLRFDREGEDLFLSINTPGLFYPVHGFSDARVKNWLDDRGFEYYWETDHD